MVRSDVINVRPFNVEVKVLIGKTIEECGQYWYENITPKPEEGFFDNYRTANGMAIHTIKEGFNYFAIVLLEDVELSVVVHECFHLAMDIADSKNAKYSEESSEFYAYMLQDIFEQVHEIWKQ